MMTKNEIRAFDADDMAIMYWLSKGQRQCDIARKLGLTPPAVSHRLVKYYIAKPRLARNIGRRIVLTQEGRKFAHLGAKLLRGLGWALE